MSSALTIVPCARRKIWHSHPHLGPVPARDAYTSPLFRPDRAYAEYRGYPWLILSARYGFIDPNFLIPGPYDATSNDPRTNPVTIAALQQIADQQLDRFTTIIALGGERYRAAIEAAFASFDVTVIAPFAGLPIGKYMQAVRRATQTASPPADDSTPPHLR